MAGLEQLHQQAMQLTRADVDGVQSELAGVQTQTLREHQRRLADLNALRDECSAAKQSAASAQTLADRLWGEHQDAQDETASLRKEISALTATVVCYSGGTPIAAQVGEVC